MRPAVLQPVNLSAELRRQAWLKVLDIRAQYLQINKQEHLQDMGMLSDSPAQKLLRSYATSLSLHSPCDRNHSSHRATLEQPARGCQR